jgi:hypothetical protein
MVAALIICPLRSAVSQDRVQGQHVQLRSNGNLATMRGPEGADLRSFGKCFGPVNTIEQYFSTSLNPESDC